MNHANIGSLAVRISNFAISESSFDRTAVSPIRIVADQLIREFVDELLYAARDLTQGGIPDASKRIMEIRHHVLSGRMDPAALTVEARNARETVIDALEQRRFIRIDTDRAQYLDHDDLFGPEVAIAFPSAKEDVKEAGNCLATECATAAVFHLMRASEVALRRLALDRGVAYPNATVASKQVGDLLMALDSKVKELRETNAQKWPTVEIRDAQIKFYAEAVLQFRGFNEAWRKHMAHAHEGATYNRDVASGIYAHVKALMEVLAAKISESTTTPIYWLSA